MSARDEAQTRLRAILNEIVISDDPTGTAVGILRDRIYIAANHIARAAVAEARAPLVEALEDTRRTAEAYAHIYDPLPSAWSHVRDIAAAALAAKKTP